MFWWLRHFRRYSSAERAGLLSVAKVCPEGQTPQAGNLAIQAVAYPGRGEAPVPVATVTMPTASNSCGIHLAEALAGNWNTVSWARPLDTERNASTNSGWAGITL